MDESTPVTDALLKGVKPIAKFGKYDFDNPVDFMKWLKSPEFKDFWAKNLTPEQIGIRTELNNSRYITRIPSSYQSEMESLKRLYDRNVEKGFVTRQSADDRIAYNKIKHRSAGRFYTPLSEAGDRKDFHKIPSKLRQGLEFYITPETQDDGVVMRVIADKDLPKFSLKGRPVFGGYIDTSTASPITHTHEEAMALRKDFVEKKYGLNLGATLSSNPDQEVFVNNQWAKPVSQGGRSRSFGTIMYDKGQPAPYRYIAYGMPKTSIPMQYAQNAGQVAKNIVPAIGAAMNSPLTGGIGGLVSIGGQIYDANSDNFMDRNYRMTDPLSVRPFYDLVLNGFSEDARRSYERLVSSPEYVERNPLSSMVGQAVRGNPEYLKAFFQAYNPF